MAWHRPRDKSSPEPKVTQIYASPGLNDLETSFWKHDLKTIYSKYSVRYYNRMFHTTIIAYHDVKNGMTVVTI